MPWPLVESETISCIWRAFALQPHRVETVKLSKDPLFIDKVCDIVSLHLNPGDKALVRCVDDKAQIQALDPDATRPDDAPGAGGRRKHDSTHHGTTTLFARLNPKSGEIIGGFHQRTGRASSAPFSTRSTTPFRSGSTLLIQRSEIDFIYVPAKAAHPSIALNVKY